MDLEQLYDFRGQVEQCLSRAENDAKEESSKSYRPLLNAVQSKLSAAMNVIDLAIKDKAAEPVPEPPAA